MTFDNSTSIIIVLSEIGINYAENAFLGKCKANWNNNWKYASTDGKKFGYNQLVKGFQFVLYNQTKTSEFAKFVASVNQIEKNVIIFRHNTLNKLPSIKDLKTIFPRCITCTPFSHGENKIYKGIIKKIEEYCNE